MKEMWIDIAGYNGLYQVSNFGRVRSIDRSVKTLHGTRKASERILKPCVNKKGYLVVTLSKESQVYPARINRLVAEAFIPNPQKHPVVNHKDRNRSNNNADNLEWCTVEYNNRYSCAKAVVQYDVYGKRIAEWDAASDAGKILGINTSNIIQCCRGKRSTAGSFVWKYKESICV